MNLQGYNHIRFVVEGGESYVAAYCDPHVSSAYTKEEAIEYVEFFNLRRF